jgi:hypothetical protein
MSKADDALERLYAADLEEFTAERTTLVRELRDAGRDDDAEEIAGRRKPPLPAFLANRLARERSREMGSLIGAAQKLSQAHRSGNAEALRDAQAELGETLRKLVSAASEVAGRQVSDPVEQRLAETLRAAAVDSGAAALLRRGILPDEVEASGFDALAGMSLKRAAAPKTSGRRRDLRTTKAETVRAKQLKSSLDEARRDLRAAERALGTAERDAARARKRVEELEARFERS